MKPKDHPPRDPAPPKEPRVQVKRRTVGKAKALPKAKALHKVPADLSKESMKLLAFAASMGIPIKETVPAQTKKTVTIRKRE